MTTYTQLLRSAFRAVGMVFVLGIWVCTANTADDSHTMHDMAHDTHTHAQTNHSHHDNHDMLEAMHKPMMQAKISESGNVDKDFLVDMIPHHQGAIDSAKLYLQNNPQNQKLQEIAKNIISSQEAEIKEFHTLLKGELNATKLSKQQYSQYLTATKHNANTMMKDMNQVKPSQNIDKDFAQAMIPHHQGAIDSAKLILQYTKDTRIQKIAQDIITAQEREIQDLTQILDEITK